VSVLVTGATGFVGGHLVDHLLAAGTSVTALVRDPRKAAPLAGRGVRLIEGDLRDSAALAKACARQQVVYHVAGATAARDEAAFMEINKAGTARLVAAAEAAAVDRFVLVSSLAAGGPARPDRPLDGTEAPRPLTRYGRSKLAGEVAVRAAKLAWTIVRPPAVYGPADREMFRIFRAVSLGAAPVFGDGSQQLSLIFGPDLAAALVAAGTSPATVGGVYYAAHPERVTSRELVATVAAAAGRRPWVIPVPFVVGRIFLAATEAVARLIDRPTVLTRDKGKELFQDAWICDPSPLTRATGWRAEHPLASGATITIDWYRQHKWL